MYTLDRNPKCTTKNYALYRLRFLVYKSKKLKKLKIYTCRSVQDKLFQTTTNLDICFLLNFFLTVLDTLGSRLNVCLRQRSYMIGLELLNFYFGGTFLLKKKHPTFHCIFISIEIELEKLVLHASTCIYFQFFEFFGFIY